MHARWLLIPLAAALACAPLASPGSATSPAAGSSAAFESLRVELPAGADRFRIEDDPDRALVASVYSLPSPWIDAGEARALLAAVRKADPGREVLVLADAAMEEQLAPLARDARLHLLSTGGALYSPWPRDPFSFARTSGGAVRVVVRPNLQRGREVDATMGPALVQALPPALDRAWGGVRWAKSAVPFHNGQVLLTRDAAWVSVHTFEPRVLELLGAARVPVESFATAAGIEAYVGATRKAAGELAALYGRSVRFVHPLPVSGAGTTREARTALLQRLAGGAGYDLDSLLTLVPSANGVQPTALVADVTAGERLLASLDPSQWNALATAYRLEPTGLAAGLAGASSSARGRALASYLDLVADHLRGEGLTVSRLPLLVVPAAVLRDPGSIPDEYFFLTWNNVVVEKRGGGARAEGFASLLPAGDDVASQAFAAAGVHLDLLPPLLGSVTRNGGYRCASNHLRATD
ncbi:MAG TPA: hypothetical protein VGS57_04250 [Thermoanaerobaculia bacterium]|jgi:hypothetical protein|nr:hypothetical protein [Thermoanaerobaculia bacterium]